MTGEKWTNMNTVIRSLSNTLIQKIVAITNSIQNLNSKYETGAGETRISTVIRGRVRCHGGVNILC